MNARTRFFIGAALVVGTVGYLMASGIKDTGVYFLTPSELAARVSADPSFYNVGVKMGARVVTGSIQRDVASQTISFQATDGQQTYPVVYRGLAPDTFTDDVDVVVEGRLMPDGTFRATTLLAKCGSRYEAMPKA
ncbi:MAG: cytochrome c maturation protein CcmE [Gemmatimonadetes bacterium]|nr:cytochrome c maturation protein CcmE [Gemmatimonadota bacterium]MBI2536652.1 cytochrome c maturation protein CcmE [Gemmatimonadota bacterium]